MPNKSIHNNKNKRIAQKLRSEQTEEERRLWYCFLRHLPVKISRQQAIGNYVVDFYCGSEKLVIELDGSQHYTEEGEVKDLERDSYLQSLGLTVVRYTNLQIQREFKSVCADIASRLRLNLK